MPRIPLPEPGSLTPEQQAVHDKVVSGPRGQLRGPLRAALYNPDLAERWSALGELLRYRTELSPRHSELAILVTAVACRSPFEWHAHKPEAEKAALPAATIDAILAGQQPADMPEDDAIVWRFARELNAYKSVSDDSYAAAVDRFGPKAVVELTALVGYYTLVAMTLNTHEIPLPPGVEPALRLPQRDAMP